VSIVYTVKFPDEKKLQFVRVSKAKTDPNKRYPSNTKSEILNWNSAHFVKETLTAGGTFVDIGANSLCYENTIRVLADLFETVKSRGYSLAHRSKMNSIFRLERSIGHY